jgi:hypothetical protein
MHYGMNLSRSIAMDEFIKQQTSDRIKLTEVLLNKKNRVSLIRGYEVDYENDKKYMRFIAIKIGNKIITDELSEVVLFKEELALFDGSEEENMYLFFSTVVKEDNRIRSMRFRLNKKKNIYFSKAEARAIITLWNMSMQGYSFARLMEYPTKQSAQSWAESLSKLGHFERQKENR